MPKNTETINYLHYLHTNKNTFFKGEIFVCKTMYIVLHVVHCMNIYFHSEGHFILISIVQTLIHTK